MVGVGEQWGGGGGGGVRVLAFMWLTKSFHAVSCLAERRRSAGAGTTQTQTQETAERSR